MSGQSGDYSPTRANIERKRQLLNKKRRARRLRVLIFCFLWTVLLLLMGTAIYGCLRLADNLTQTYDSMYAGYTERHARNIGAIDPHYNGYTNVLILGLDDGVNAEGAPGQNADTVLLMSLDNNTGDLRFIFIPRDTAVEKPGTKETVKVGSIYADGGAPMAVRAVSDLLGVSVHQYVTVDTVALKELIDAVGGIDIYVEKQMDYDDEEAKLSIHISQGYQHLDGEHAQQYLRYQNTELGELGRVHRQQHFIRAIYEKMISVEMVSKLPDVADIVRHRINTSAEVFDAGHLSHLLKGLKGQEAQTYMLPGNTDGVFWYPDEKGIEEQRAKLFPDAVSDDDMDK